MRIGVIGKGGSGKTTISALIAQEVEKQGRNILAIDADFNGHLGGALGFDSFEIEKLPPIGNHGLEIKEYLRGTNSKIQSAGHMMKTTTPGNGSILLNIQLQQDALLSKYILSRGTLQFLKTGEFKDSDVGTNCFHIYTNIIEILLHHIVDTRKDIILCDMTAGVDSIGSGLFACFDFIVVVVEPTIRSIAVYEQFKKLTTDFPIPYVVVGNKIKNERDVKFIQNNLPIEDCLFISELESVIRFDYGESKGIEFTNDFPFGTVINILKKADNCKQDKLEYLKRIQEFHKRNSLSWANAKFHQSMEEQIDTDFRYPVK